MNATMEITSCNRTKAKAVDTFENLDEKSPAMSCVLLMNLLLFKSINTKNKIKRHLS